MAAEKKRGSKLPYFTKKLVQHARRSLKEPAKRRELSAQQENLFRAIAAAGPGPNPRAGRRRRA